uniref:YVTN family beta-propeller domain-containing protein n=1 Tax=Solibacter usitatus (strain Ellin6076) TaxID=234267 RepID=Q01P68_SOLUE
MAHCCLALAVAIATFASAGSAQQATPYKVLKSARVGGEGGWDYIYADAAGRRLYIPRGATRAVAATDTTPAVAEVPARLTIFNLDTLDPAGEIAGVGGNGTAVDPKSGHGFTSDHPKVSMFDTKTLTLIKSIDVGAARPDGILFDDFNQRVYVFSHPTKDATVIDSKDGRVLGTIDLGGVPEQGVADGKGMLYVVMQDAVGSVTAVDVKTMKAIGHYSFVDKGGCNGLALDVKNKVLFAACGRSGNPPAQPAQPLMVILSATDGKILASLPLAGGSDGAAFSPSTMEAFSTHGNGTMTIVKEKSPASFEVEQNLQTMNGARTVTFDSKTGHLFTMSQERGPAPPPPPGGGRGGQGTPVPGSFTILMIGR